MSNLLSEQLKALCKRDKMSQKELAEKLFVSQQAVGKWEKDTAASNPDTLAKIADIFNVSVDYLLGLPDKKIPPVPNQASEEGMQKLHELMKGLTPGQQEELYRYGKYLASERRED